MYKQVSVLASLLVFAVFAAIFFIVPKQEHAAFPAVLSMTTVTIGSTKIEVEIASTPAQRAQGLSGRALLQEGRGMLFVFALPNKEGFWMKDMHFSLDIIWVDSSGAIVTITDNISPNTYPQSFYPSTPALYVLEVPAGFAKAHGIAVGDKVVVQ